MKDIVVISDDEETDENETVGQKFGNKAPTEISNFDWDKPMLADKPLNPNADGKASGTIHLPILSEMKKEILSQASKEIESIFGEPDEELLESVLNINPYIYKTLNNNNLNTAGKKLCDGDEIEVPEETHKSNIETPRLNQSRSPIVEIIIFEAEDYDENIAMSQAVLQEMKEEMADESTDLSYSENERQNEDEQIAEEENEYLELCNFKKEIATQMNEDEILLIEDDDDDLFSKFTDWSSKLLSQNVMSQVYPLEDEELSAGEIEDLQVVDNSKSDTNEDDIPIRSSLNGERSTTPNFDASGDTTTLQLDNSLTSPTNVKETVLSPTLSTSKAKNNNENRRKPTVIVAPYLPKYRGKLRAVSAANDKESVLNRQRSVDNETVMKTKWYQKPKDKKNERRTIKEKRREELKKLAEKSKCSAPANASSSERKRKPLKVPTIGNSNRGEFLTVEGELPTTKRVKLDKAKRPLEKPMPKRHATIECYSQKTVDVNETDVASTSSKLLVRPIKRKDAEIARNQRTCNRVTFADMESDFELRQLRDKQAKKNRHVRFNDIPQIKFIERVEGANKKVRLVKDTKKLTLSTYAERRAWAMSTGKLENYNDIITGDILSWGNQWLKTRNADEVAESDVLMPIPTEFSSYKQYKE